MKEKIGNVTLNYKFYKGNDLYTDGAVEDQLLEIVKNNETEESIADVLSKNDDWALLYHLSEIRHNVLEWYDFDKNANLLEIGSGCGAITGLFCEKVSEVKAIDLSQKRSTINAYRNKNCSNLEIYVGNFEDVAIEEKFDYVTLIGVLEYAIYYIDSNNPFLDMLKKAKEYLKEDGKLIIAIENKYGLKYWAGAREDHTGNFFDGIEGYEAVERVRTFSKNTLQSLINDAGFNNVEFFYPVPDYKMPLEIYSEKKLPKKGDIKTMSPAYDRDRLCLFDERKSYDSLCEDGLFEQFANSFIVIAN